MKIAIWNMPCRIMAAPNNVPLGIYAVGAAIKQTFPNAQILYRDLNLYRPALTQSQLDNIVAATRVELHLLSGLITTLAWQEKLSISIRSMYGNVPIVSGGGLATNIGEELLNWIPIDAVCIGEGDIMAPRIVKDAELGGLSGGLYRKYEGIPADMDALPEFPWGEVQEVETYIKNPIWGVKANNSSATRYPMKRSLNFVSSRGCPFPCKFCSKDALGGRNYRAMAADRLGLEIVKLLRRYNLDWIGFTDDNFLARSRKDIGIILSWLSQVHEHNAMWGCHARFDECDDGWLLDRLYDGGCRYIGFGGESANQDILDSMSKGNKPEQMGRVIEMCRGTAIHPGVTWMWNWPGETRLQVRDTARFILQHAPDNKCMFVATAYPGTELWEMTKDKILDKFGSLRAYVSELEDATKPVINLSAMSDSDFSEVRAHIDAGELEKI